MHAAIDHIDERFVVRCLREYRRGMFASGGTTDVAQEVTGQPAEDLETIVRRYAAADPMAKRSVPHLLRAMAQFAKILLTRPLDVTRWMREHGLPVIEGEDCADASDWTQTRSVHNAFGVAQAPPLIALSS